jgi:C4-dicarboxylate-specific signal transduction histidine kinase
MAPIGSVQPIAGNVSAVSSARPNIVDEAGAAAFCVLSGHGHPDNAQMRARQAASLATLAGGIAHHFNNIVCGMSTMAEMALGTDDPATMKRALKMSAEAAGRIAYITKTLLACSCQHSGAPDLADLTEELLNFSDRVGGRLAARGIVLDLDLRAQRVAAVPHERFAQVLECLLRNAEEAFEDLRAPRARRITITTQSRDEQILLQFSDNAIGIAPEHVSQIFDPFFTTKGVQSGGTRNNPGLGLTLALGMVMDLDGHIWAESIPGQCTTLNLLLPIVV